jgi:hypothetical protein
MEWVRVIEVHADFPLVSSPWPRVSHRFDQHLREARNTIVHPYVTPFGRNHVLPRKAHVTVAAYWRVG